MEYTDKHIKFWKRLYPILIMLGLISLIRQVDLFRVTIINVFIPTTVLVTATLVAFFMDRNHYYQVYQKNPHIYKKSPTLGKVFYPLLQNLMSWGCLSCFIFMASNYYFLSEKEETYKFKIIYKYKLGGGRHSYSSRQPAVTFDYFGFKKELVFKTYQQEKVDEADSVSVNIRQGALGFDVITKYNPF